MFNEEARARVIEFARELKALMDDNDLLFWEGGIVRVAPVGAAPTFCTVEIEGVWDENVRWSGIPTGLVAGDEVLVWENPVTHRREIIAGSGATATKFVHDHSSNAEGGDDLNPATITPQTFLVGPTPCPYDTLGEAVTAAVAFGPAAATPCTIQVQGIVTAEAGDVTVPQYCHVEGLDEGSTVGMGANTLIMSDDSSLADLVVTSSDAADAIRMNGVTNVVLRNVRAIQGEAADVFHVYGASLGIEMYGCIAEATVGNAVGFHVGDTADVYLDNCIANDPTNFADALLLDATLCAAVTRRCTFIGNGDDVQTGANSVWYHLDCHFYGTNCTLAAGTHYADPTKRFNQTLIVSEYGGDFQALSEAITYINAQGDAAAAKLYGVLILHGNFAEAGDVTIPRYVHAFGMGEGSEIEMGANTLLLSSDSSLQGVVVESSDPAYGVRLNGATGVEMDDVKIIMSAGGDNIEFDGASSARLRHVILERSSSGVGFDVLSTSSVELFDCEANDTTNFSVALQLAASGCTATTRHSVFRADTDDVSTGAGSTWEHLKCEYDANNVTLNGTETPLTDGAIEIASDAIRGHSSLYPDLGTTTLAQKLGNVYLARCYDIYPDHDEYPFWRRMVNFGVSCPDEHWHQGADELVWIGWAAYVGYATPNNIQHDYSQKRCRHNAATRAFYYRAAATGDDIYLRQGASLWITTTGAITLHAGLMIDDGVDAADGNGANNYYRVMVEATALTTNWNIRREYRVGGGAPVAAVTAYSLPPGDFYCPVLVAKPNPNWANWWAGMYYRRTNARETLVQLDNPPFAWTPARAGLYYYVNGANNGFGLWDWYDEATA